MKETKGIQFNLRGVSIDQFATPFEPTTDNIEVNVSIPIKTNYQEHAIAVGANIQFVEDGKVFIIAEVFCHYLIEQECWKRLSDSDSKDVVLPKEFINNLSGIAIGTVRGVLCAKTENTPFSKFFVPLVMISPDNGVDLTIPKPE